MTQNSEEAHDRVMSPTGTTHRVRSDGQTACGLAIGSEPSWWWVRKTRVVPENPCARCFR